MEKKGAHMRSRQLILATAFAIGLFTAHPASADDEGGRTYDGGGGVPAPLSAAGAARNATKSEIATAYLAYRKSGGMPADFPDLQRLQDIFNDGRPLELVVPAAYPAQYSSNSLGSPSYQAQINDWYCGPASAWVAMTHLGIGNNHFGASLTQSNLGTWYWLETDTGQQTPRGENWRKTLNGWVDATNDGWYEVQTYGSWADAADVASKFALNIDANHAPVMNVWMTAARGRLPGWGTYADVKHYVPGLGYGQYGDYLHYVEVFATVGAGYKYDITKEFFAGIVASYGMIW